MTLFPDYLDFPSGRAILLSVKPRFAELILTGSKRVEFRRKVPSQAIGTIALYSSAPTQAIIALVEVLETIEATSSKLWEVAKLNGGGLTRQELRAYFEEKETGFAFMLGKVQVFADPIDPKVVFKGFTPPQSFKYLTVKEHRRLVELMTARSLR